LIKKPGEVDGIEFSIKDLEDCKVYIFDLCAQVFVDRCVNTQIYLGPVKGTVFFRDCENCTFAVANGGGLRVREVHSSTIYYYGQKGGPVIESSSQVKFAPYNLTYPLLKE